MRNPHRIAAAGALIGLAVAAGIALPTLDGGGRAPVRPVASAREEPHALSRAAGVLLGDALSLPEARPGALEDRAPRRAPGSPAKPGLREEKSQLRAAPRGAREAQAEAAAAGPVHPLVVLSARRTPGHVTGEVLGMDPHGPRPLTLWQIGKKGGRGATLARGESAHDGRFRFESLLLPHAGIRLVVTPRGLSPGDPGASLSFEIAEGAVAPPGLRVRASGADRWSLELHWARAGATLLVADEEGRVLSQHRLPERREGVERTIDLEIELELEGARDRRSLLVAQSLADGRRSPWRPVAPPSGEGAGNAWPRLSGAAALRFEGSRQEGEE